MISTDADALAPGVQTDIHLRTSLQAGDVVTLDVLGADGTSLDSVQAPAAADGSVVFTGVSVPAPRVMLRATGRGTCGEGRDEITVDVLPGAECTVHLAPEPESNAHYAPLGVLSQKTDPDPAAPGYQTTVRVVTRPGWSAEIFQTTTGEASLGVVTAGEDGVAALPVTLLDGQVELRATCRGAGTELASQAVAVLVDTTAPTCDLVAPVPGTTITAALDQNHNVTDGLQIAVTMHANGADVDGEPVTLAISGQGGEPVAFPTPASDTDAGGTSTALASLARTTPATYDVMLTMRDHAGNTCTIAATYDVAYDASGCTIAVTSPITPVTHDVDGTSANGSQVDVALAVAPACAGLPVTATCPGLPDGSGLVGLDGTAMVRTTVCLTSPCQTSPSCTFQVTDGIGISTSTQADIIFDDRPPVTDFVATPGGSKGIRLTWTSPDHGAFGGGPPVAYLLKSSLAPITDTNFDAIITVLDTETPGAPGSMETLEVSSAPAGVAQYFAIATLDAAGHRSAVATAGPIVLLASPSAR